MIVRLFISALFAISLVGQSVPDFDALVKNADAARDSGKFDRAVPLYRQALHLKPDWKQGWWVLGSILYDSKRFQEAEEAFLPLTVLDPDKSPGWSMAGLCEFEIKHYQDALTNMRKAEALGLPPGLFDVTQYHIDLILIRTGQFDMAIEAISLVAAKSDVSPELAEAMGIAGLARAVLPEEIPMADRNLIMSLGKAMCDGAANNGKLAIDEFQTLIARYPRVPRLHYLYGLVLLESDTDKALSEFKQELALSPRDARSLISIASEYVKRNEFQTALPYAEKAVIDEPKYFAAHAMLGKVLVESQLDLARGTKELETAVKLSPGNPQSRLALASAYSKLGRKNEAALQRAEFLRLRTQNDSASSGQTSSGQK